MEHEAAGALPDDDAHAELEFTSESVLLSCSAVLGEASTKYSET